MLLIIWMSAVTVAVISADKLNEEIIASRIRGGQDAEKGAYPWQILMGIYTTKTLSYQCGGAIITKHWVLTAAHCFAPLLPAERYFVIAGEHELEHKEGTEQWFTVQEVILHDEYNKPTKFHNDVALMKIVGEFKFNEFVSSITLATPQQNDIIEGNRNMYCVTSGWGRLGYLEESPRILQALVMPLLPLQLCQDNNSNAGMFPVTDSMLCTGYGEGDKSPCHGDSGGPLACLIDGRWTIAGITSWGKYCGYPGFFAIFTRVSFEYDWITKKISNH